MHTGCRRLPGGSGGVGHWYITHFTPISLCGRATLACLLSCTSVPPGSRPRSHFDAVGRPPSTQRGCCLCMCARSAPPAGATHYAPAWTVHGLIGGLLGPVRQGCEGPCANRKQIACPPSVPAAAATAHNPGAQRPSPAVVPTARCAAGLTHAPVPKQAAACARSPATYRRDQPRVLDRAWGARPRCSCCCAWRMHAGLASRGAREEGARSAGGSAGTGGGWVGPVLARSNYQCRVRGARGCSVASTVGLRHGLTTGEQLH